VFAVAQVNKTSKELHKSNVTAKRQQKDKTEIKGIATYKRKKTKSKNWVSFARMPFEDRVEMLQRAKQPLNE
jgi:lipocalin